MKKWLNFCTLLCCTHTWHSCASFLDERDRVSFCLTHLPGLYFHLPPALVPFCRAVSGTSILRQTQECPLKWFTAGLHLFRSCLGQMQCFGLFMEGFLQTSVERWSPLLYLWLFNPSSRFLYFFYSSDNIRASLSVCRITKRKPSIKVSEWTGFLPLSASSRENLLFLTHLSFWDVAKNTFQV